MGKIMMTMTLMITIFIILITLVMLLGMIMMTMVTMIIMMTIIIWMDGLHPDYDVWDVLHPSYEPWDDHEDHIHHSLHPFKIQGKIMMTIRLGLSAPGVQFILSSSGPGPRSGPGQVPGQVEKVQGLRAKDLDLGYTLNLVCHPPTHPPSKLFFGG